METGVRSPAAPFPRSRQLFLTELTSPPRSSPSALAVPATDHPELSDARSIAPILTPPLAHPWQPRLVSAPPFRNEFQPLILPSGPLETQTKGQRLSECVARAQKNSDLVLQKSTPLTLETLCAKAGYRTASVSPVINGQPQSVARRVVLLCRGC